MRGGKGSTRQNALRFGVLYSVRDLLESNDNTDDGTHEERRRLNMKCVTGVVDSRYS